MKKTLIIAVLALVSAGVNVSAKKTVTMTETPASDSCALNGGEDYELLFTVPLAQNDTVSALEDIRVIGYITEPDKGCALITRDGGEHTLKAQGWNPLKA